ncbi:vicilin-like seed storage protein At2g18540 [Pseudomyrmex gracilis]|uniref:vicilin-like seed storage protein At2g18540 n=1 Tax=Pseudomyrmex gracilis TaxID=219809 RepID=UPI000995A049|nr:vicilin-like seed storage protein At2g18540 [Pseudomyrmex gracilis]
MKKKIEIDSGRKKEEIEVKSKRDWWDNECRDKKSKVRTKLQKWRRERGDKKGYKEEKRSYKELCERKREEENKRWVEKARKERTEKEIWKIVNRERKKKRWGDHDRIEIEEWDGYFKKLLGRVEWRVMQGEGGGELDKERKIEREESVKVMKKIKVEKAAGRMESRRKCGSLEELGYRTGYRECVGEYGKRKNG